MCLLMSRLVPTNSTNLHCSSSVSSRSLFMPMPKYHAALDRLAAQLIEDGSCRIVDISLENLEQAENKNAAATYLYRVDCDGEWGEIYFDFENKKIKIQRLAEWDTTRSHKYAWKAIGFIALRGDKVLPQKKCLIFWNKRVGQKKKRVLLQDGSVIFLPRPR